MHAPSSALDHVLLRMSGVLLIRTGPPDGPATTYRVVEPAHVAHFSQFAYLRPLRAAVAFFMDLANAAYSRSERPTPLPQPEAP